MMMMMFGMGAAMFFWVVLATLVFLLLIAVCIWFVAQWLKAQQASRTASMAQPQAFHPEYEQGYQPQQQPAETTQEGEQYDAYPQPQYEQPQSQYPQRLS